MHYGKIHKDLAKYNMQNRKENADSLTELAAYFMLCTVQGLH